MKKYLTNRSSSFKLFDIKYTYTEKQTISNFKIENESAFYYRGKFDSDILIKDTENKIDILTFISSIGNNTDKDIKVIKKIIYKLLNKLTKVYNKYYIELDIIISLKRPKSITRWHIDAYPNNSKFVTTLIGQSTLFIDDSDIKSRNIFYNLQDQLIDEYKKKNSTEWNDLKETHDKYNKIIATKLKKCKIVQPNNNQGTIFLTDTSNNNSKFSGIHSEPTINENRFFIGLLCYK